MPIEAIIAIAIGVVGLAFNIRAVQTGHNALARIGTDRAKSPKSFVLETGLLTAMSLSLIFLGLQIAKWI